MRLGTALRTRRFGTAAALALVTLALGSRSFGATPAAGPVDDRDLAARAQAEGSVVLYIAMTASDVQKIADRFHAQYGITLQTLRIESDQIPTRVTVEQRAGRFDADVVAAPGFQTDQLKRAGALLAYRPPEDRAYRSGYVDPDGYWTVAFLNTDAIAYNPARLAALGLKPPTSWFDFTRPEWHGRFAIFNGSYEWYDAMHRALGDATADKLMKGLAANQPAMVSTHDLALTMTAAGEYAAALNAYGYHAARLQREGRPIRLVNPDPTIGEIQCVALAKQGPHPNAARLFVRWLLSQDTQQWMVQRDAVGRISGRKDVASDPDIWSPQLHIVVTNPADSVNYASEARAFNTVFGITQ